MQYVGVSCSRGLTNGTTHRRCEIIYTRVPTEDTASLSLAVRRDWNIHEVQGALARGWRAPEVGRGIMIISWKCYPLQDPSRFANSVNSPTTGWFYSFFHPTKVIFNLSSPYLSTIGLFSVCSLGWSLQPYSWIEGCSSLEHSEFHEIEPPYKNVLRNQKGSEYAYCISCWGVGPFPLKKKREMSRVWF